ncbi:MAG: hypothetical protein IIA44_01455, partial [Acidobacteria bacterium]|nr:hypothetical protein [Acidobacteriota bacterium]
MALLTVRITSEDGTVRELKLEPGALIEVSEGDKVEIIDSDGRPIEILADGDNVIVTIVAEVQQTVIIDGIVRGGGGEEEEEFIFENLALYIEDETGSSIAFFDPETEETTVVASIEDLLAGISTAAGDAGAPQGTFGASPEAFANAPILGDPLGVPGQDPPLGGGPTSEADQSDIVAEGEEPFLIVDLNGPDLPGFDFSFVYIEGDGNAEIVFQGVDINGDGVFDGPGEAEPATIINGPVLGSLTLSLTGIKDFVLDEDGNLISSDEFIFLPEGFVLPEGVESILSPFVTTLDPDTGEPVGTLTLTIIGEADISTYEEILRGVVYRNDSDDPTEGDRLVNVQAVDGAASEITMTTITVVPVGELSITDVVVNEDAGTADFTVTLTGAASTEDVTFSFATEDGTAKDAVVLGEPGTPDYTATTGEFTFVGSTEDPLTTTISVPITSDQVFEPPENFVVNLEVTGGRIDAEKSDLQGVGTITDAPITASVDDADAVGGEAFEAPSSGGNTLTFTVSLDETNNTGDPIRVFFTLSGDTGDVVSSGLNVQSGGAHDGEFYVDVADGTGSVTFDLPVVDDADVETASESVTVTLAGTDTAGVSASDTGSGTITDLNGTLTINNDAVLEGTDLNFAVSLSITSGSLTVGDTVVVALNWTDVDTDAADYGTQPATVTLTVTDATTASGTIVLTTATGGGFEGPEALTVAATGVTVNGTAAEGITLDDATGTITDGVLVKVDDADTVGGEAFEAPSSGGNTLTFTVGSSEPNNTGDPIRVFFTLSGDTGDVDSSGLNVQSGGDNDGDFYVDIAGDGTQSVTIDLPVVDDAIVEPNSESVTVTLTGTDTGAVTAANQGTGTITDLNGTLTIDDSSVTEGTDLNFAVTMVITSGSLSLGDTVEVALTWADVDTDAADYGTQPSTVTLTVTDETTASGTIVLTTTDDNVFEGPDETLTVTATGVTVNGTAAEGIALDDATGTIIEDDPAPVVTIGDQTVVEGVTAIFTVSLDRASDETITLSFQTKDGTAVAGGDQSKGLNDYDTNSGTITFLAGETSKTISVTTVDDKVFEGGATTFEDFEVNLTLTAGKIGVTSDLDGTGKIEDNEAAPTLSIDDPTVTEGDPDTPGADITFTVTKTGLTDEVVTVNYTVTPDSAVTPGDYSAIDALSGTLTFAAGETSKTITLDVTDDLNVESTESFTVTLSGESSNATISKPVGTGTILDNDIKPALLGVLVINEVGLSGGTSPLVDTTGDKAFDRGGDNDAAYIELRAIANTATGFAQAWEDVSVQFIDMVGNIQVIRVTDFRSVKGNPIANSKPAAKEYVVIYEDGTWAKYNQEGGIKDAGFWEAADSTGGSLVDSWELVTDTSGKLAVNLVEDVDGDPALATSIDALVANGVDTSGLISGDELWEGAGTGSTAAADLLGSIIDNNTFSGLLGDQGAVLSKILKEGAIDNLVDGGTTTTVFSRVLADDASGVSSIPGDTVLVAQVDQITLTGSVDLGDEFSFTIGATVTYVVQSGDSSLADVAAGLAAAINDNGTLGTADASAGDGTLTVTGNLLGGDGAFTATVGVVTDTGGASA